MQIEHVVGLLRRFEVGVVDSSGLLVEPAVTVDEPNLGLNLRSPDDYISEENQRLRVYKRIAGATNLEEGAAGQDSGANRRLGTC